jgi:hypothetical protein
MPTIQQLSVEYARLTHRYIASIHVEEAARLKALPTSDSETINAWLDACKATDRLNDKRIASRSDLLRVVNPQIYS